MPTQSARLAGRRALVTGAGDGIGAGVARALAAAGASVLVTDLQIDAAQQTVDHIRSDCDADARAARLDVTDSDQIATAVATAADAWGGLDVLVCNAGGTLTQYPRTLDADPAYVDRMYALNARSVLDVCRAAVPLMSGGGSIITIASAGALVHQTGFGIYGAMKAAVVRMTQAIAGDHAADGIRANAICPGTIRTDAIRRMMATAPDAEDRERQQLAGIPLGRFGTPEDIGQLAVFLASEESSFMTGTVQVIDGGATLG